MRRWRQQVLLTLFAIFGILVRPVALAEPHGAEPPAGRDPLAHSRPPWIPPLLPPATPAATSTPAPLLPSSPDAREPSDKPAVDAARRDRPRIRLDRFTLGFASHRSAPAFAVCREIRAVRARQLPVREAAHVALTAGFPQDVLIPRDSLPPIEPPGICVPAGEGIRAYLDLDFGFEPDDESDDGDRGWSAGVAIDF